MKIYTFDRFIRLLINIVIILAIFLLLNKLSGVLLPFLIGWLIAYLIHPLVNFFQYRLKVKNRILSVIIALILVIGIVVGLGFLIIPLISSEIARTVPIITNYAQNLGNNTFLSANFKEFIEKINLQINFDELFSLETLEKISAKIFPHFWNLLSQTWQFLIGIFMIFIIFLYVVFILKDYEKINNGFLEIIPPKYRRFVSELLDDVTSAMNRYFRGQALIAFIVGILYAIGFSIIGLPMAILFGILFGILNLVPYLQTIGFVPVIFFGFLKSVETGTSFWTILLGILIVFLVIQSFQDLFLVPKIMGKNMGLNPAIILLSLSVWGVLLGFTGLIIALPLTTLVISYYKRFVLDGEKIITEI